MAEKHFENPEVFGTKKNELIGMEAIFTANVRNNKLFNTNELTVNNIEQINIESLIESLKN